MNGKMAMGIFMGMVATGGFASEGDGIFSINVGQFEVFMLTESQREGSTDILVDPSQEVLAKYVPASGFMSGINAFLIKAPGMNILVDAGTGSGGVLITKLKQLGVEPDQIGAVLLTHLHGDHFGGLQNNGKVLFPNAKVYLDAKEYEYFTKTNVNQSVVKTLALYKGKVETFKSGDFGGAHKELLSGITAIASYGHTPGHTVFLVENGGNQFIIAGDFLHVAPVQFPVPSISATYDTDPLAAAASRKQLMDYAAKNRIPLGGVHLAYPGMGMVEADGDGFRFTPLQ
jgi:glyoxylase-like metal-dependent hydrolase (beta-lactamase superfamily II)